MLNPTQIRLENNERSNRQSFNCIESKAEKIYNQQQINFTLKPIRIKNLENSNIKLKKNHRRSVDLSMRKEVVNG